MGNRISLCMIARDEEGNLGRCLDSAAGCVDEIVVVDTGSGDATVAVAQGYGAGVWQSPWQDDFSLARNRSLQEATGEWILVLDADEELPRGAAPVIRELAATGDTEAWTFTIVSPVAAEQDSPAIRQPALRMFRNRAGYRFEGLVYEQVQPSILRCKPAAGILQAGLLIHHHGYTAGAKEKRERNIRLLQTALVSNPFDPFQNYNLGLNYLAAGEAARARTHFEIALLAVDGRSGFSPALYLDYARCLYELGDLTACLKLLDEGLGHFPAYPDLHFLKGRLFYDLGLLEQARACFLTCTGFRRVLPEYTTREGVTSHLSQENLAGIALREGDPDLAVEYLVAVCRNTNSYSLMRRLGLLLQRKGLSGPALRQTLAGQLDPDEETLARLLYDLGEYEACLEHTLPAEDQPWSTFLRAGCLTRMGQPAAALALLESLAGTVDPLKAALEKRLAVWLQETGLSGVPAGGEDQEITALSEEVAYAAWLRGERETALALAGAWCGEKARLALAAHALVDGRPAVAEDLLVDEPPGTELSFLKGRICGQLGRHQEAFVHFLQAARTAPDDKSCYVRALEQAITQCRNLVLRLLPVEGQSSVLQLELFRLAARQKKLSQGGIDR